MIKRQFTIAVEHYYQMQATVKNSGFASTHLIESKDGKITYSIICRESDVKKVSPIYRVAEYAESNGFIPLYYPKLSEVSRAIETISPKERKFVRIISSISYFSVFGQTHLHKAITEDGELISWSSPKNKSECGEYEITGRVKKSFRSFEGDNQITILNYVKVIQ